MIKIVGEASRSFVFPANLETAYEFFSDIPRLVGYLPHITLIGRAKNGDLRVRFSSTELASYTINVVCDLRVRLEPEDYSLHIEPIDNLPAIHPERTLSSATARGYMACHVYFADGDADGATTIRYTLDMRGKLPRPSGLRFMPAGVINRIAQNITSVRLTEIADGFIDNSTAAFRAAATT